MHNLNLMRPLLLILLLLAGSVGAHELPRRTAWPHETGDVAPDPAVVWGKLDNGMRYVLLPNDTPKDRVSLRLAIDAGSLMESEDQRGLAHFLEHMAFKGSQNMPKGDLVQYLERLGMAFGADTNARTSFESTVYQLELPSNSADLLDRSLFVLREKADRLLIAEAELERERGVILSEKRMRDTPQARALNANLEFLFPDGLIPDRIPIGTDEVLTRAPVQRLADFYRSYYTPSRTTLVAVGALDPDQFAGLVRKHFESFRPRGPEIGNPELGRVQARGVQGYLHYEAEGRTSVSVQVAKPLEPQPDTQARRQRELDLHLAHAMISRRLATAALQPDAGFVSGTARSDDFLDFARVGSVTIQAEPGEWQKALTTAERELRRALTHGFTAGELDEQRRTLLTEFEERARAADTRESDELAEEIVYTLGEGRVFTDPAQDLQEISRGLKAVTPETALEALRELWSGSGPLVFVAGPVTIENAAATIAQAYRTSEAQPVAAPAENAVHEFAYTRFGAPSAIVSREVSQVLGVTQIHFANGVRLNLLPTKYETNSVLVAVRFGAGRLELPTGKPGLEQLAEAAFLAGGLERHGMDDLNRMTAGRTVAAGFDVEDDAFTLSGRTTPADLMLQLQLLTAYMVEPGYRAEAMEKFRRGLPQMYQSLERTPMGVMQKSVTRFLRGGDSRFGYPEREVLSNRTLDELRAALAEPLRQGYLEVSLVGDFKLEPAIEAVAATFGSLPPRDATKADFGQARTVRFPRGQELAAFPYDTGDPKALAAVYWPTTDFSQVSEVRRLFVLARVLGNRVLERVRNVQGLTYTAQGDHAPSQAFPGYGFLYAIVDAPPDKARSLALEIREIGAELNRDGVTDDELERARNPVVSELSRLLRNNAYLLSAIVSGSQENPAKLERAATSLKELSSLTVEEVNQVARKYLKPDAAVPVVIVPRTPPRTSERAAPSREKLGMAVQLTPREPSPQPRLSPVTESSPP
jgi:zinc protease